MLLLLLLLLLLFASLLGVDEEDDESERGDLDASDMLRAISSSVLGPPAPFSLLLMLRCSAPCGLVWSKVNGVSRKASFSAEPEETWHRDAQ